MCVLLLLHPQESNEEKYVKSDNSQEDMGKEKDIQGMNTDLNWVRATSFSSSSSVEKSETRGIISFEKSEGWTHEEGKEERRGLNQKEGEKRRG